MLLAVIMTFVWTILVPTDAGSVKQIDSYNNSLSKSVMIGAPYPEGTCELAWFEASMIASDDIQDPSTDLDIAISNCRSTSDWMSQAAKYPKLLYGRDPMLILRDRCLESVMAARVCE